MRGKESGMEDWSKELFYTYPVTDYAGDHRIRISITGEEEEVLPYLKGAYSLGQAVYIDGQERIRYYDLTIDLYTPAGAAFAERLAQSMPGLSQYPEYARIRCFAPEEGEQMAYDYQIRCGSRLTLNGAGVKFASEKLDLINLNQKYANLLGRERCASFAQAKARRNAEREKDRYNYESSYACSAHMPCRLALFGENGEEAERELARLLNRPAAEKQADVRYRALVLLEHRRWNAYMIADGYRAPSPEAFEEHAFRDWRDHKDKKNRLHPCICDGGEDPFYLKNHPEAWHNADYESDPKLSELDRLSIRCFHLCCRRAEERREALERSVQELESGHRALEQYCTVVRNYISDTDYRADFLYKRCREEALTIEQGKYREQIKAIDQELGVFKTRNARKDFSLLDVNIIDALSFDLWHGRRYQTVITACSGNAVADLAVSFLVSCRRAVFLCDTRDPGSRIEQRKLRQFFAERELGTPEFLETDMGNIACVRTVLNEALETDEPAFACTRGMPETAGIVFGEMADRDRRITLLGTDGGSVVNLKTREQVNCGIRKCITVQEYLELLASEYENVLEGQPSFEEYDALRTVFQKYTQIHRFGKGKSCTWSSMAGFFEKICKSTDPKDFFGEEAFAQAEEADQKAKGAAQQKLTGLRIDPKRYQSLRVGRLLADLKKYRIIGDYSGDPGEGLTILSPDQSVRQSFRCIAEADWSGCEREREIWFTKSADLKEPIALLDTRARDGILFLKEENPQLKSEKLKMLKDLSEGGIAVNFADEAILRQKLYPEGDPLISGCSFDFSSLSVKRLFQTSGKVFELILFHQIRELGIFDDVQTGVKIAWDDTGVWDFTGKLDAYFEQHEGYGKSYYTKAKETARTECRGLTENEIDVILMRDMRPTFISCKTGTGIKNEWLYEIAAVAGHFRAKPVLAVSFSLEEQKDAALIPLRRARGMGITLIGSETIFDSDRFQACMKKLAAGETMSILDD